MGKLHEKSRFKQKIQKKSSIFDCDYTHEELMDELEDRFNNGKFLTKEEAIRRLAESREKFLKKK